MIKTKKETIKSLAIHEKDVGSTEIQIGLLTDKITKLSEHFKKFKKDKHSTLGLTKSVNKRKKSSQRGGHWFRVRNKHKKFYRF